MKKTFHFCLAVLLLSTAAISCGSQKTDTGETTPQGNTAVTERVQESTEPAYDPPVADMGGRDFHILTKMEGDETGRWTAEDFKIMEADGDTVNDAIYARNATLEEKFNCNIENHFENMGGLFSYTLYKTISKLIQSGDTTYDMIMPPIQDCAKLAADGMLWDLSMIDGINLDKPWWNQVFDQAISIGGKSYYANGDISLTFMRAAYAVLFNKNVLTKYDLDNPYTIVNNGTWTLDTMMEMARAAAEDLNGDGVMDSGDNVGLAMLYNSGEAMFAATGVKLVTVVDGALTWTGNTEESINVMNKLYDIYTAKSVTLNCDNASLMDAIYRTYTNVERGANLFSSDKALFLFGTMNNVPMMREMPGDFGILPIPKYDTNQERYYSYVHTWSASAAAIPITAQKPEETALFMDAAAYYAREIITPAYYDTALKTKYARDEESQAMLDLIYENRWCDLGNLYNCGEILTGMTNLITNGKNSFASMMATKEKKIQSEIDAINEAFKENE
ncbi:MAG: extracellular solute-binding protein [Clostridia bacterium]|nr:extracellular solute-binding protein [Clostridia bacterium]